MQLAALGIVVLGSMTPAWATTVSCVPAIAVERTAPLQVVPQEIDTVTVTNESAQAVIAIKDDRGIGRVSIRRNFERWPAKVVVRAYLRGLESLTISAGTVKLSASVLSHSGHPTLAHLWREGQEGPPLKRSSPYWLEIRRLDTKGQPVSSLPPQGGCFEVTIPQKLLDQASTFELHWIDFYR
jgi:hypothetical protein